MANEHAPNNHARNSVLSTLASSGNQLVQLGTLGLVAISGLISFFQTSEIGEESRRDRDKAIDEIHLLYEKVDDFEKRQKTSLSNQQAIMDANNKQLQNQAAILQGHSALLTNQENVLKIMRDNQQRALESLMRKNQP